MFTLNKEVSRTTADIDADDVLNTKKELNGLGYYKPDEKIGMNKFTDEGLFGGIGKFQQDNKLKVDEVMKPGGETEAKINEIKQSKKENTPTSIFGNKDANSNQNFRKTYEIQKQVSKESEITKALSNRNNENMKVNSLTQTVKSINTSGLNIPKGILNPSVSTSQNKGVRYAQATTTRNDVTTRNAANNELLNSRFNNLHNQTRREEGGYVDDPARIDQPTNVGIIQPTLDGFRRNNPTCAGNYPTRVSDLTQEQIAEIYRTEFYDRNNVGLIESDDVRRNFYDFIVNHSPNTPRRALQEAINQHSNERVEVDAVIGPNTINALNRATRDPEVARRISDYINDRRNNSWNNQPEEYRERFPGVRNRIQRVR